MSRGLAVGVLDELYALSSSDPLLALIEIDHPDLAVERYARNYDDVVSNGDTFTAASFDITVPNESEDRAPTSRLTLDLVDQVLITRLRAVTTPGSCKLLLVFASDPDAVVYQSVLKITSARWTVFEAELSLDSSPVLDEPYPGQRFSPSKWPGLFAEL